MAAVEDNIREVEWRDLADTVLIVVCTDTPYDMRLLMRFQDGLFAAFLSAFLIFLTSPTAPTSQWTYSSTFHNSSATPQRLHLNPPHFKFRPAQLW